MSIYKYNFIVIIVLLWLSRWTNGSTNGERVFQHNQLMNIILAYIDISDYTRVIRLNEYCYGHYYPHLTFTIYTRYQKLLLDGPMKNPADLPAAKHYVELLRRALKANPDSFLPILAERIHTNVIYFTGFTAAQANAEAILHNQQNQFTYSSGNPSCIYPDKTHKMVYNRFKRQLLLYRLPFVDLTSIAFKQDIRLPEVLIFVDYSRTVLRKEILSTWRCHRVYVYHNPRVMHITWKHPTLTNNTFYTYFDVRGVLCKLEIEQSINQHVKFSSKFQLMINDTYKVMQNMPYWPPYLNQYSLIYAFYHPDFW